PDDARPRLPEAQREDQVADSVDGRPAAIASGRPGLRQDRKPNRGTRPNRMQRTRRAIPELQLQLQRRKRLANTVHPPRDGLLRTQEGQRPGQYREVCGPLRPAEPTTESVK